jgi:ribosomal protein S18 acetylase RimI-like enzyme
MPDPSAPIRITPHAASDAALLGPTIYVLYAESFRGPPHVAVDPKEKYLERWARHAARDGFLLLTVDIDPHGGPVGYLYGYRGVPGTWWHDFVAANLPGETRERWLADAFEIVELGVAPEYRGKGWGTQLIRRALEDARTRTVALSTQRDGNPAVRLYLREGFVVIHPGLRFSETGEPFVVMARGASPRRSSPSPSRPDSSSATGRT